MASETKHTPGPWKLVVDRDGLIYRLCGDGMWFAKLSWTVTGDRNDADARLMTAAPDMLAALEARKFLNAYRGDDATGLAAKVEALEAYAIAKAT